MRRNKGNSATSGAPRFRENLSGAEPADIVRQLHAMVREARVPLTAPTVENLDDCRRRLDEAAGELRRLQASLPGTDPESDAALAAPLAALRSEIARVATMLDGAAAFHVGWIRLAARLVSGYTADGTPAAPESARRVLAEV
jgi:hypothetical protein